MKYKTVYLDPPWMEKGAGQIKRGADKHYPLMNTKDIINLLSKEILPFLDENCHLYLWVTNNFFEDGFKVLNALGFSYITCITWNKDSIGLGQYFRGNTEHCLFAKRGKVEYKTIGNKRLQGTTGFFERKKQHSKKPLKMLHMIEDVSHPPYLEVFARDTKPGWTSWGNEVEKFKSRPKNEGENILNF